MAQIHETNSKDLSIEEFKKLLKEKVTGTIVYKPVREEILFEEYFPLDLFGRKYVIPADPNADPFEEAATAKEFFKDVKDEAVCIFIPGKEFDAMGTRHGKGAGWYDRFLSAVPKEWLRVGLCYTDQFSSKSLHRETWDEPMDFVCEVARDSGIMKTWKPLTTRSLALASSPLSACMTEA